MALNDPRTRLRGIVVCFGIVSLGEGWVGARRRVGGGVVVNNDKGKERCSVSVR